MSDNNSNKKKVIMPIVALVVVGALVLLLGTYAYWQVTRKQTNRNLVGSACLDITFSNETGDLDLENQWPISDSDGSKLVPYTFTLTNTCPDELVAYTVALEEIKDDRAEPIIYPDDYLSDSNLKIKFDTLAPVKISTLDNITNDDEDDYEIYKTKKIINRKLAGGESRTHSIRMWLDANAPQSEMNKFFLSKIKIIAGQGIEEECYAVNSEGLLYAYDPDCGTSATIPAIVDGKQVKIIASNAFKGDKQVRQAIYHDDFLEKEENDTVPTKDDFARLKNNRCKNTSNTSVNCTIDYSVAYNKELYEAINDENYMASIFEEKGWDPEDPESEQLFFQYIGETFSVNDIGFVIYYNGNDTERANFIRNVGVQTLSELLPLFGETTPELINSRIYTSYNPTLENYYEIYSATTYDSYNDSWKVYGYDLGYKEPTNEFVNTNSLVINSLDLSKATNLVRIDNRAFSNLPNMANSNLLSSDICDIDTGLTSLTFGTNKKEIRYGGAVFAGANLDTLSIYNSMKLDISPLGGLADSNFLGNSNPYADDITIALGILPCSTINTLNIVRADNNDNDYKFGGSYQVYSNNGTTYNDITHSTNNNLVIPLSPISGITSGSNIGTLNIDNQIDELGEGAFAYSNITNLNLSSSLQTIGNRAFVGYNGNAFTLPSSLVTIGDAAFSSYRGTNQNLVIPASVRTIGEEAFWLYNGATLTFNEGLQTLGDSAFGAYQGADFTLPSTIRNLGEFVFNSFRKGTIHVNMTQANFQANVNGTLTTGGGDNNVTYLNS